jgi:hypothetical protein
MVATYSSALPHSIHKADSATYKTCDINCMNHMNDGSLIIKIKM